MKNWQRLRNHYGKRDMWIYETESGESKFVECDEDGWIPIEVLLPEMPKYDPYSEWLITDECMGVTAAYRWNDGTWDDGEGLVSYEPTAWQPLPNPYKPPLLRAA